jgi:hypothetical protein
VTENNLDPAPDVLGGASPCWWGHSIQIGNL